MPLTPADVHNIAFKKPPIGKRGYDEDEVDAFLDEVEREFARLIEENNDLKGHATSAGPAQATEGDREQPAAEAATATAAGRPADHERLAAENAELKTRLEGLQHQLKAAETGRPADPSESEQALSVLVTAQRTAHEHVSDARREADKLMLDARGKADALARSAKEAAESLEKGAREKYQQAMGGLEITRASLQRHIEELKAFEREYRSRLKAYLEGQLRDLDGKAAVGSQAAEAAGADPATAASTAGAGAPEDGSSDAAPDGQGAAGSSA